jgi:tetratricopeptide (TPR) repeat protein
MQVKILEFLPLAAVKRQLQSGLYYRQASANRVRRFFDDARGGEMARARYSNAGAQRLLAGLMVLLLTACAQHSQRSAEFSSLPPLQLPDKQWSAADAAASVTTPDLLGLSPAMREFGDRYVNRGHQFRRLQILHSSLRSPAFVDIRYDPVADGTAAEAFARGSANCLTYAHLFVSLARYAGLDARYLAFKLRPQWARHGQRVALSQHVNVLVKLRNGAKYVVDIDPINRGSIASAAVLDDEEAFALYHGNLAMDALLSERQTMAFAEAVRAVELSTNTDYLWVNLGAIYRQNGQNDAAEKSYLTALHLNPNSRSAMNNLAVLYESLGDVERSLQWRERVAAYRQRNPYYHIYLGELAEAEGNPDQAIAHYRQAIALKDSDAEFYYRLAKLYFSLHQRPESIRYVREAIERSRLVGEREEYQNFLRQLSEPSMAQLLQ